MMADLVAESGGNKGQLSNLVETLCRNFRIPDETGPQKLIEWQKQVKWSWSTRRSLNRTQSSDNVPYRTFGTRRIRNFVVQARGTRLERFSNGSRRNSAFPATSQEFRSTLCLTFKSKGPATENQLAQQQKFKSRQAAVTAWLNDNKPSTNNDNKGTIIYQQVQKRKCTLARKCSSGLCPMQGEPSSYLARW